MGKLGIVIIGYKNTIGICRLLESLSNVDFCGDNNITLIFSIDYSGDDSVSRIANSYQWNYGTKYVLAHTENMGLRKHILSCGNYMNTYDLDAIAVLEDDIYVSPEMYSYMKGAVDFYKEDEEIAGVSLYKHEYNINAKHPFVEFDDGSDVFFVQYAMSWGQIWFRDKWNDFIKWYNDNGWEKIDEEKIPNNIKKWKNSWLKYHIMYCIDKNLYFVYPRTSLSTDFSDVGTHNKNISTAMQVQLCMKKDSEWRFIRVSDTVAVYDAFFENVKLKEFLGLENVVVDLNGVKEYTQDDRYILTRKCMPYKIINSWGLYMRPIEANVLLNMSGSDLFLYDIRSEKSIVKSKKINGRYFEYDLKGINILCLDNLVYCIQSVTQYIKNRFKK